MRLDGEIRVPSRIETKGGRGLGGGPTWSMGDSGAGLHQLQLQYWYRLTPRQHCWDPFRNPLCRLPINGFLGAVTFNVTAPGLIDLGIFGGSPYGGIKRLLLIRD